MGTGRVVALEVLKEKVVPEGWHVLTYTNNGDVTDVNERHFADKVFCYVQWFQNCLNNVCSRRAGLNI